MYPENVCTRWQALLQVLARKISAGQRAGRDGLSDAVGALERQRMETQEARAESKRLHESLLSTQVVLCIH